MIFSVKKHCIKYMIISLTTYKSIKTTYFREVESTVPTKLIVKDKYIESLTLLVRLFYFYLYNITIKLLF